MTKELDCIIETGHYLFNTSSGVTELMLEYNPSLSHQSSPSSSQPTSVKDPETVPHHMQRFPHLQQESQSMHETEATQLADVQRETEATQLADVQLETEATQLADVQRETEATQLADVQCETEATQLADVQCETEATQLADVQRETEATQVADIQRWNHEQIGDFVCKLGFLDMDKIGDRIKHFLHVNEVCVCWKCDLCLVNYFQAQCLI